MASVLNDPRVTRTESKEKVKHPISYRVDNGIRKYTICVGSYDFWVVIPDLQPPFSDAMEYYQWKDKLPHFRNVEDAVASVLPSTGEH